MRQRLREAFFETSLSGIKATGEVYPLGAFLLVGAMLDMLAGLMYAPQRDNDGHQAQRYEGFVDRYFNEPYGQLGMGQRMWDGLRCRPLHNFSAQGLLLADSQSGLGLHLHVEGANVVLHWPEFVRDYEAALSGYWSDLERDPALQEKAERRCQQYPPLALGSFPYGGLELPLTVPARFGTVATAYGGPPLKLAEPETAD